MKYSLPESAGDLLIKDGKLLMRSLSVYEVLRRFSHIIRLTPFKFEDFNAALLAEEQSSLIAEMHIQLLKTLIREDRQQQTWLGPPDLRDSVSLHLHLADHATWPAALRIYLSADTYGNSDIIEKLKGDGSSRSYPFNVSLQVKLDVLEQLCDQFLLSNLAREEIVNGSNLIEKHDNICRSCSKANGDLVPCGTCSAVYHLKCSDPPLENYPNLEDGDETYSCAVCRLNHIIGVSDCIDPNEKLGNIRRHESLGMDKLGRQYWFLVRRLFVVDEVEEDVRYYTTIEQLEEILDNLNANRQEKNLINNLQEIREEIERQMKITQDLYQTVLKEHKKEDGSYALYLGQDGAYKSYTNHYTSSNLALGKGQHSDRDVSRTLSNKFSMSALNSFKWSGAISGHLSTITGTIKSTILKFETMLPHTFVHPCWKAQKSSWIRSVNLAHYPQDYAITLSQLESCIKPVLFKSAWYENVGFSSLFRSTFTEREELKKTDRQPRGFERREWFSQDFELSYRLGTMVKFSPKLKPVKHQVWKQKGEEYRLTGLNGWYWRSCTLKPRPRPKPRLFRTEPFKWLSCMTNHPFIVDMIYEKIASSDVIDVAANLSCNEDQRILYSKKPLLNEYKQKRVSKLDGLLGIKLKEIEQNAKAKEPMTPKKENGSNGVEKTILLNGHQEALNDNKLSVNQLSFVIQSPNQLQSQQQQIKKYVLAKPKMPPCHDFMTNRGRVQSLLVLPSIELHKLARSGGLKETKSFSYTAKQNNYVWPYGMTPRPTFRACWLYKNRLINTIQDVALQLKVIYACLRWEDLQVRPPASGHNVITTDEAIVTIELLKKRDKLPYLTHSEYLIKKVSTPIEQPTKYRKIGSKKSTPSARSGLRARRQTEEDEDKGPTTEEIWVPEEQLELWELKQFDEKIERQNQLMRERAIREEAERRRKSEEEKRRKAEQERKRKAEEEAKKVRLAGAAKNAASPGTVMKPNNVVTINQPKAQPTTPVLTYFRTEQGQIIRLPASYLERGTPLILRHVGPGPNQTNTYIIRPQITTPTNIMVPASTPTALNTPNSQPPPSTPPSSSSTTTSTTTSTTVTTSAEASVGTVVNEMAHDQREPGT